MYKERSKVSKTEKLQIAKENLCRQLERKTEKSKEFVMEGGGTKPGISPKM